jgi:hypothetical protein
MAEEIVTEKQRAGVLALFREPKLSDGVQFEPRGYFDVISLDHSQPNVIVPGNGSSFYNSEAFPVRITHLTAAVQTLAADARMIQRIGIRIRYHDAYYMAREPALIPLWSNTLTTIPDIVTPGVSVWDFEYPFILGQRDSLRVQVQQFVPNVTRSISVGFHGVGTKSKRPYFFSMPEPLDVSDIGVHTLDATGFRSDGSEPIAVTGYAIQVGSTAGAGDPTGDSRAFAVQIRQIGNGTNRDWFQGPDTSPWNARGVPAAIAGVTGGRALVHRIPGDGFLLMPGDGFIVDAEGFGIDTSMDVAVGIFGVIAIK